MRSSAAAPKGSRLEQMLARKPRMLVTVALAYKMAGIVWVLLVKQENCKVLVADERLSLVDLRSWQV